MSSSRLQFRLLHQHNNSRCGIISINGIHVPTPAFMPVATQAAVKAAKIEDIAALGYKIILANSYHLYLRPGVKVIEQFNGLHDFMQWKNLIITDSGGFQVFSLSKLCHQNKDGFIFRSHIDGSQHTLTPESVVQTQQKLGSNIMMVLDECLPADATYEKVAASIQHTFQWAQRSYEARTTSQSLFGIIQGGLFEELRAESCRLTTSIPFDGFALGGLSIGETREDTINILKKTTPLMPTHKPRYLMGIGHPIDILYAVESGIDIMDCVLPTRNARNGSVFTHKGFLSIKQARYKMEKKPLDENCSCFVCQKYSCAYLHHAFKQKEILSSLLLTHHNLHFMKKFMENMRLSIFNNTFTMYKDKFLENFTQNNSIENTC